MQRLARPGDARSRSSPCQSGPASGVSRFQSVSPWRTRSSVVTVCTLASHGVGTQRTCLPRLSATGGIGLATARLLAAEGARVVVSGRDPERVEQARRVGAERGVAADVGEAGGPETAVAAALELGGLDCLVNNVGVAYDSDFLQVTDEVGRALAGQRAELRPRDSRCRPTHEEHGAGVSSTSRRRPAGDLRRRCRTTRSRSADPRSRVGGRPVREGRNPATPSAGPAATATPCWARAASPIQQAARTGKTRDEVLASVGAGRPLGRLAEPDEIAAVIAFLCSASARDGGRVERRRRHRPDHCLTPSIRSAYESRRSSLSAAADGATSRRPDARARRNGRRRVSAGGRGARGDVAGATRGAVARNARPSPPGGRMPGPAQRDRDRILPRSRSGG